MGPSQICPLTGNWCLGDCDKECKFPFQKSKPSTPVRTVTRKEIVPGTYGPDARLSVETGTDDASVFIELDDDWYEAFQIRELARLLSEIADAMEEKP